jgi:hypothetical protein
MSNRGLIRVSPGILHHLLRLPDHLRVIALRVECGPGSAAEMPDLVVTVESPWIPGDSVITPVFERLPDGHVVLKELDLRHD